MSEPLRYEGRVALVTGAGHGLGRLYALGLAQRGARVVLNDIDPQAREALAQAIREAGGEALCDATDIARPADAGALANTALERFGRIDILINNAGFVRDRAFHNMSSEELHSVLDVHLAGAAAVTRAAWPHLRRQHYGRVVFTTSSAGLWGNFGQANYSAAKLGVVGLMHTLELEGAAHGIRVNTVAPFAMTRMGEGIFPDALRTQLGGESVLALVLYLCSERCAVSGELFEVGAGRLRRVCLQASEGVLLGTSCTPEHVDDEMCRLLDQPVQRSFRDVWEAFDALLRHCAAHPTQAPGGQQPASSGG